MRGGSGEEGGDPARLAGLGGGLLLRGLDGGLLLGARLGSDLLDRGKAGHRWVGGRLNLGGLLGGGRLDVDHHRLRLLGDRLDGLLGDGCRTGLRTGLRTGVRGRHGGERLGGHRGVGGRTGRCLRVHGLRDREGLDGLRGLLDRLNALRLLGRGLLNRLGLHGSGGLRLRLRDDDRDPVGGGAALRRAAVGERTHRDVAGHQRRVRDRRTGVQRPAGLLSRRQRLLALRLDLLLALRRERGLEGLAVERHRLRLDLLDGRVGDAEERRLQRRPGRLDRRTGSALLVGALLTGTGHRRLAPGALRAGHQQHVVLVVEQVRLVRLVEEVERGARGARVGSPALAGAPGSDAPAAGTP